MLDKNINNMITELIKTISEYPLSSLLLAIGIGLFLEWVKEMTELFLYRNQKEDEDIEDEEDKEEDWREKI